MMRGWLACIVCMFALEARGAVELSFPLEGYWRPGRYMPVRVEARDAGEYLEIAGAGVVPARVMTSGGRFHGVVPVLVMSEPRGLVQRAMRQVGASERLV